MKIKTKKNKAKNRRNSKYDLIRSFLYFSYFLFLFLFFFVLTLYMNDGYYDLMLSKAKCFIFLVKVISPFIFISLFLKFFSKKKYFNFSLDFFILLFCISYVVSTLLSYSPEYAFSGKQGWYVGSFAVVTLTLIYFSFNSLHVIKRNIYYPLVCLSIFEFFCTLFDSFHPQNGPDILNLRDELDGSVYYNYWGTIGNSNWYIGLISLLVPLFICIYLDQKQNNKKILFFIASYFGLLASVLNGTDSIYLVYGFCSFFIIRFVFQDITRLRRFSFLMLVFAVSLIFIKYSGLFRDRMDSYDGYIIFIYDLRFLVIFLLISGLLMIFSLEVDNIFYSINKRIIVVLETILLMTACTAVFCSAFLIKNGLTNERLSLWELSLKTFITRYTLRMKLFGIGPELLINVYAPMNQNYGAVYNSSHSEAIQVLLTTGIFGFVSWAMCWFSIFEAYIKNRNTDNAILIGIFCSFAAYFGQSLVNSATLLNASVFTFLLILMSQLIYGKE